MSYRIGILRRAQKELAKLPEDTYKAVRDAIVELSETLDRQAVANLWAERDGASESELIG